MRKILLLLILYILFGTFLPFIRQPAVSEETASFDPASVYGADYSGQRVDIISDNTEALAERIRLISRAQDRIILSTSDFKSDVAGKQVLSALADATERGVRVQVIVDGFSGLLQMEGDPYFYALSAQPNAQVKLYNPIRPWLPWTLMSRLHDKYLVADDTAFLLGGRNTYSTFLGEGKDLTKYDWDALVWSEDSTDAMEQVTDYFQSVWDYKESKIFHDKTSLLEKKKVREAREELREIYQDLRINHADWFSERDYATTTLPAGKISLLQNPIHTGTKEPVCYYELTEVLASGSDTVIHTPYLICNGWMMDRLGRVCEKNSSTRMLTNSVANNSNPFGATDYRAHRGRLLNTGVHLLEYDSGVSYHGKCARIDDNLTVVGSLNFDMRSAYIDTELMLVIDSPEVNAQMAREMQEYEDECLQVIDADHSIAPEGHTPRTIPVSGKILMGLMRVLFSWAPFFSRVLQNKRRKRSCATPPDGKCG